jgi:hypothetical protein
MNENKLFQISTMSENKNKLFKITMEHTFVVVDDNDATVDSVEKSLSDILRLHAYDIIQEPVINVLAEPIQTKDDLPDGWVGAGILPYSRFSHTQRTDLVNLSINEIFKQNAPKPPVAAVKSITKYVVRLRDDPAKNSHSQLMARFDKLEDAVAEVETLMRHEKRKANKDSANYYIVKINSSETEELITTLNNDTE